jgi:hypothetical protein
MEFFKQFARERPDVFQPVCACANQQHWNSKFRQVLLTREFPIHRHECVKFLCRQRKQIAVPNAGPASARYSSDFVADQIVRESPINALIRCPPGSSPLAGLRPSRTASRWLDSSSSTFT